MNTERNSHVSPQELVYHIDACDRIVSVEGGWLGFARANGAPELTRDAVSHQEIWRFIDDPDTRLIYRLLFDAVRSKTRSLTVSYRCDSPTRRRFMELTCIPAPDRGIELRSRTLREETRPYIRMLDKQAVHSERVVKLCAWCKRCQVDEEDWREMEDAVPALGAFDDDRPPIVSHGMCPECHQAKIRQIRNGLVAGSAPAG